MEEDPANHQVIEPYVPPRGSDIEEEEFSRLRETLLQTGRHDPVLQTSPRTIQDNPDGLEDLFDASELATPQATGTLSSDKIEPMSDVEQDATPVSFTELRPIPVVSNGKRKTPPPPPLPPEAARVYPKPRGSEPVAYTPAPPVIYSVPTPPAPVPTPPVEMQPLAPVKRLPPMDSPASFVETEQLREVRERTPRQAPVTEQITKRAAPPPPRALPKPPERPNTEHPVNKPPIGAISKRPRLKLIGVPKGRKVGSTNAFIWYNLVYRVRHGQYAAGLPSRMHPEYDRHPKMSHARAHVRGTFQPSETFVNGNSEKLKQHKQWPSLRGAAAQSANGQRQHA